MWFTSRTYLKVLWGLLTIDFDFVVTGALYTGTLYFIIKHIYYLCENSFLDMYPYDYTNMKIFPLNEVKIYKINEMLCYYIYVWVVTEKHNRQEVIILMVDWEVLKML